MSKKTENQVKDLVRNETKRLHSEVRWNNSKMFSEAKAASDVKAYIEGQPSLWKNLEELIDFKI